MIRWGDLDEHGFRILHQLRSYYPQNRSVMMNRNTFEAFKQFAGKGERSNVANLPLLNEEEQEVYKLLKTSDTHNRLEQEKITQVMRMKHLKN